MVTYSKCIKTKQVNIILAWQNKSASIWNLWGWRAGQENNLYPTFVMAPENKEKVQLYQRVSVECGIQML